MRTFELNQPDVVSETIDGEAVVINLDRGIYFSIRGTGLSIWSELLAGVDADSIASRLAAQAGRDVSDEVGGFVDRLIEEALVRPRTGSHTKAPGVSAAAANDQYEPPTLEKYTDMEALLLLDPIHDVDEAGWPNRP